MPKRKNSAIKSYQLKNGQKRYMFRIFLGRNKDGKKIETTRRGFKNYEEANAEYNKLNETQADNFIKQKQFTFDEVYQKWLEFYKRNVKESTLWKTETAYKVHIEPVFGNQYIDQITTDDIANYFLDLSTKYVNYKVLFWYMRRIFEYAIDLNIIDRNPARASLLPKKTTAKRRDTAHNFYTSEEVKEFLNAAKNYNEKAYVYFLLLATTGIRKGEGLALHWSDIDFDKKQILIQRTVAYGVDNRYITQSPKGNRKRYVPLDDHLATVLKKYRSDLSTKVFHNTKNEYYRPTKPDKWRKQIFKNNPDLKNITIHGLRHTFATILNQNGLNPKDVAEILGHKTVDLTLDVYTHSTTEGRENIREQIKKLF